MVAEPEVKDPMAKFIGSETMLHISFSLAAFIFSVVLYIMICALGTGQVHKNFKFRTLTITVVIGNAISILDNIFRDSGIFPTPVWLKLLLLLLVYLANILLTYYMALYMEGFFPNFRKKRFFFAFNSILVLSSIVLTIVAYCRQLILYDGEAALTSFPFIFRLILGYDYELYFLIYTILLFIILGKTLSKRARITSVAALTVVIGGVLIEVLNTVGVGSNILFNYFGAVIGLYIFYIGVETPDYKNLMQSITELDEAKQTADEANRAKSDFLANMSHEIRSPLNAVLGMNEMIIREAEDDTILTYSENIKSAGVTLLFLINDILDFSKIEAGKIDIIPSDYRISNMITDLLNVIRPRADEKGLILSLDFDKNLPESLNGDEMRIKQVITNILTNAVKYTEKGNIAFRISFEKIAEEPYAVMLNVTVADTGIGIRPEDMPKLFSEFERIEEKRNRHVEGTGLGMSITQSLLTLMGTSLRVESEYGVGSTFSFSVKQSVVSWEPLGDYEEAYLKERSSRERYHEKFRAPEARILLVDDTRINLTVFRSLIKRTLVKVETADNSEDALRLSKEKSFDMLFLDHMMPGKNGIDLLHEIKSEESNPNRSIPAICLTANAISGAKERYLEAGFDDYLTKPIDPDQLENMLLLHLPKEKVKLEETYKDEDDKPRKVNTLSVEEQLQPLADEGLINLKVGLERSGSEEVYRMLLRSFSKQIDRKTQEFERLYAEGDIRNYTIRIHGLKSTARLIGAESLGAKAEALERAAMDNDIDAIEEQHGAFLAEYAKLRDPLGEV